jgi:tetratricopeptide (TPR) repeat protein
VRSVSLVAAILACTSVTDAQPAVTFTRDVAPILFAHCVSCHRDSEIGGFSLLTYRDARPRASAIARATRTRAMPPWKPEAGYGGDFLGARQLTDGQIDTLQRWAQAGSLEGDPAALPPFPALPSGWRLGQPDLVVQLDRPYTLAGGGADVLRNFVIPAPLARTRYVRGVEFRPGNSRVVHHANIRIDRSRGSRLMDAGDPEPGFDGLISAGRFPDGHFLGWTPGQLPPLAAEGQAWRLEPDSDFVVQLHLQPGRQAESVQPSIGLFFADTPPDRPPLMLRLGRQHIDIPAGAARYQIEDAYRLPVDVEVLAIQPHAHFRAREVSGTAVLPDGTVQWLLYIRDWDFNWQDVYRYAAPPVLPAGTVLRMQFTYDNSPANRRNPDRPPQRVRWGQNTTDEMGDLWVQVRPYTVEARERLTADFGPKVLAEDAVGYETLLQVQPDNVRLHEAVGALYLSLNETSRGVEHLEKALAIDPSAVEAHYNLATALVRQGHVDQAVTHFERVLQLDPAHASAHVNLGAVQRARRQFVPAAAHLRLALELDPGNAAAHTNLAGVLVETHDIAGAVTEYRRALASNPQQLEALVELAWTLATSPDETIRDAPDAMGLAERAVELTSGRDVRALDAQAAAYAAAGLFDRAVATLEIAIEGSRRAGAAGADEAVRLLRSRLEGYQKRVPYLDPTRTSAPRR